MLRLGGSPPARRRTERGRGVDHRHTAAMPPTDELDRSCPGRSARVAGIRVTRGQIVQVAGSGYPAPRRPDGRGRALATRRYPSRDAPVPPVLRHAPRRPVRGGDAVPPAAAPGGLRAPAGRRAVLAAAAGLPGDASGSSRSSARRSTGSAARRWRCRSSIPPSCGRSPAATTPIGPEMARFKDRAGRDMVIAMTHEEVVADLTARPRAQLPPAADDRLPLPDEVPRRAAVARRADPRPRVRDEGLVQPATATRPASTSATGSTTRPTRGSSSGWGSTRSRSAPTSG